MGKNKPEIVPAAGGTISLRLDQFFLKGIELVIEKEQSQGFTSVNRTDLIKRGLEKVFSESGITKEEVRQELIKSNDTG